MKKTIVYFLIIIIFLIMGCTNNTINENNQKTVANPNQELEQDLGDIEMVVDEDFDPCAPDAGEIYNEDGTRFYPDCNGLSDEEELAMLKEEHDKENAALQQQMLDNLAQEGVCYLLESNKMKDLLNVDTLYYHPDGEREGKGEAPEGREYIAKAIGCAIFVDYQRPTGEVTSEYDQYGNLLSETPTGEMEEDTGPGIVLTIYSYRGEVTGEEIFANNKKYYNRHKHTEGDFVSVRGIGEDAFYTYYRINEYHLEARLMILRRGKIIDLELTSHNLNSDKDGAFKDIKEIAGLILAGI